MQELNVKEECFQQDSDALDETFLIELNIIIIDPLNCPPKCGFAVGCKF